MTNRGLVQGGGGSLTAVGSELILFGGASVDGRHFNDTWRFNPTKERQENCFFGLRLGLFVWYFCRYMTW